jgi:hypothetical protein
MFIQKATSGDHDQIMSMKRKKYNRDAYAFHRTLPRLIKFAGLLILIFNILALGSGFLILQLENNQSLLRAR